MRLLAILALVAGLSPAAWAASDGVRPEAQHAIATDWVAAFQKYVGGTE